MKPFDSSIRQFLLLSPDNNNSCVVKIKELLNLNVFACYKLTEVTSLNQVEKVLSQRFNGTLLVHVQVCDYEYLRQVNALRRETSPSTPIIAFLDGDGLKLDVNLIFAMGIDDVVCCNNNEWLQVALLKHLYHSKKQESIIPQSDSSVIRTYLNKTYYEFPLGIVRVVVQPDIYVDYVNKEAQRILGHTAQEFSDNPDLRKIFLPDERIDLILENAASSDQFIRGKFKVNIKKGLNRWVEAIYVHGFNISGKHKTIEVILLDITEEEINKTLQKAVYDISRLTSTNFSLNRIFTIIHKIISDLINIDNFYIALYDQESKEVSFPYYVDTVDNQIPKPRKNKHGLTEYVIRTAKTLLCNPTCLDDLLLKNEIEILGTRPQVWLGVPLIVHEKVIGAMVVQHYTNPEAFGEKEQYILEYFSEQVARTIDFKRKADTIKLLSTAVEQSPVSIVITTLEPQIIYVNNAFTRVTGYTLAEVLGKNPRILQSGQTPKSTYTELWDTITAGNSWSGEFVNKRKNGDIFYEETRIVPITDELGKNAYYLCIKIDITEKKKLINDLIMAKEKAEESDRLKTAFLQSVSHEIRTPMNAIVGFSEILEADHDDEEKIKYYTGVIKQRSFDLLDIVNGLLDIARIESGQLKAELKPFDLEAMFSGLHDTFEGYQQRLGKHEVAIQQLPLPQGISRILCGDEVKLRQVFANLVHNALKFTHAGFVEFGFHELQGKSIVFKVTDTGIGIPTDMQDKIFERFQKFNPQGTIYEGLGLGLAIVKSLVGLMGGEIWLESEEGKGSTFFFSIPYLPQKNIEKTEVEIIDYETIKNIKLLVVEDDAFNVAYFDELFSGLNIHFHISRTGVEAIDHFSHNPDYDLVLMDIKLPDMSGYEVIDEFKRINNEVPIIAQTAYAAESDRIKALDRGCVDYISKPIFRDKLLALLQKHSLKG